ncbi:MAG: isochorismate synthase [Tannerellaceae bacterium]|jgi:isochorismate synthase|nr:isochorismate synthase [Tannerellaceae bacterium]
MTPDLPSFLDYCIKEGRNFAVCRIPGSDVLRFVSQEKEGPALIRRIEALNGESGFVIAPFRVTEACPIVIIRPDREELIPFTTGEDEPPSAADVKRGATEADALYASRFNTFMTPIRKKQFSKLVLSRNTTLARREGFSPAEAFMTACRRYTRSYVYLFHTVATGCWMGSTPEILLSGEKNEWSTVALAGTQQLRPGGELPDTWDDKNLIEQMLVSHYIRRQLGSFGIHAEEEGPYTVRAGHVAHLKTNFRFALPHAGRLGDLIRLLHPTPAVSGLPKDEASRFITTNEGYDRKYYSGFAGWLDPEGRSDLYVNLRCMNISPNTLTLYAGGGLLPSSVMEDEWTETEDKLQTMLSVIL